jgi:hypothetical protein
LTLEEHAELIRRLPGLPFEELTVNYRETVLRMAQEAEPHLVNFLRDNSDKTAEELEDLAHKLSPGGAHTGGTLALLIRDYFLGADPFLLAAVIRWNWHGGKIGFQFLPNPAETDLDEYIYQAGSLLDLLEGDARLILTGEDRAFFDSLPDRLTVYRGCAGISIDHAAAGVCWTTKREVAEWFALRTADITKPEPILLSARIAKADIRLAKAAEFEVVTSPYRTRVLKCRRRTYKGTPAKWSQG